MNPTIIIVICSFDLYGLGKYRYTFENRCLESPHLCIGDERLKHLHEKIKNIKLNEQMEVTYMKMEERDRLIREEGMTEGLSLGIARGEERINQINHLSLTLTELKRYEDLERAAQDHEYQEQLLKEFGL